jgi:hypothetical protein
MRDFSLKFPGAKKSKNRQSFFSQGAWMRTKRGKTASCANFADDLKIWDLFRFRHSARLALKAGMPNKFFYRQQSADFESRLRNLRPQPRKTAKRIP